MKCLQAIWPCESFSHEVTAFTISEDFCIWTGSSDGAIIKWKVDKISSHIHPILYLCGHMASIKIITNIPHCDDTDNSDNKSIIISIDEDGIACSWDSESGICIGTEKYIEFTKSIGIISSYIDKFLYFSLDNEIQNKDNNKEEIDNDDISQENEEKLKEDKLDTKVYTIVSLDYSTLEIMSVFQTNLSLNIFETTKLINDVKSNVLDFHLFNENEHIIGILGITSDGKFLYWNMKKQRNNLPNDLIINSNTSTILDSPLLSASFSQTGNEILIVSQNYWCFLSAQSKTSDNFPCEFSLMAFENLKLPIQQPKDNSVKDSNINESEKDKSDIEDALISHAIKHLRENFESSAASTASMSREETGSLESITFQYNNLYGGKILYIQNELNEEERETAHAKFVFWDKEGHAFIVEYDYVDQNVTSKEFAKSIGKCFFSVYPSKNVLVRVQSINYKCSKRDDAKYSKIHDAKVTIFSYKNGKQLDDESITNLCSGKLRDLWYPVEPYETMSTTAQITSTGRRLSIEGNILNDGLQSTLSYLNEGPPRSQITCMSLIGGTQALPYILVQGFSDGEIHYSSLASYSIPALPQIMHTDSVFRFPSMGKSSGHNGAVLCFLEITYNPGSKSVSESEIIGGYSNDMPILVSGGEDGSLRFWSLDKNEMGKEIFAVYPHTESVMRIIGPSEDSIKPWCDCIVSMGEDGVIGLTCLKTRKIERIMSGHKFNTTTQIAWDCHRGFLGTLTRHSDTSRTNICIWDLYSGRIDRLLYGDRCEQMFTLYYQSIKEHSKLKSESKLIKEPRSTLSSRVKVVRQSNKALRLLVGPKPDISLLEIDLEGLLPSSGRFSGVHDISFTSSDTDVSLVSRIATCLLLLHAWGANHSVDTEICKMVETLKLNNLDASWIKYNGNFKEDEKLDCNLHTAKGVSLTQGVVTSESGAVTLQLPFWVNPLIKITDVTKEDNDELSEYQKCQRIGPLWQTCPDFVAAQLVCVVSMAKKLMHEGLNEIVCSACSSLVKLYAIKFIHKVPGCIYPSLEMLVNLWDNNHDVLKESARVLIASTTNPEELSSYKHGDIILDGFDELKKITDLFEESGHDITNREIIKNDTEILVSAAICCVHSRLVSNDLLNICIPYLVRVIIASKIVTPESMLAAVIFSEGLSGTEGLLWINTIKEIEFFIYKILDLYETLCTGNIVRRIKSSESSSNIIPKMNISRNIRKAKSLTDIDNRNNKNVTFDELNIKETKTEIIDKKKNTKTVTFNLKNEKSKPKRRFEALNKNIKLPWGHLNIIGNGSSHNLRLEKSAYSNDSDNNLNENSQTNETIKYKEVLVTMITAIANLNLKAILNTIHNKMLEDKVQEHHYILAVVSALSSLLKQRDGLKKIIKEIVLLIQVFMVPLSFQDTTIKNLIKQSITSLLLELDIHFPMIQINKIINNIAIGIPFLSPNDIAETLTLSPNKLEANSEAIMIYDLNTGQKRKSLTLGRILKQITTQWKDIKEIGISALSFRKDGEMIAAYFQEIDIVCVWDLKMTWQQKLIKGYMIIEPCKLHQINKTNEISNVSYTITWKNNDQICISEGENEIEIIDLNVVT